MGGCETHSARPHNSGDPPPATPAPATITARLAVPRPDHRPPLAGVKLVRPRPRPDGRYRCGRSSLTHGRAAAPAPGSGEESQQYSHQPDDISRSPGQLTMST